MSTVDLSTASRSQTRRRWRFPLAVFVIVGCALAVVIQVSHDHLKPDIPIEGPSTQEYIGGWMQYDTGWYVSIAAQGYERGQVAAFKRGDQSAVAYFPGYPLAVRQVARVTHDDYVIAAEVTTVLSGLAVFLLFWMWCAPRMDTSARRTALLLLALYPYAWYLYGTGYGDAFFVAFTIAAFLLLERDRPVLAGLMGAIASASRVTGVGTIVGLVVLMVERSGAVTRAPASGRRRLWSGWRFDRSKLRARDSGVLLSVAGFGSYCLFVWHLVGDALAFVTVQAAPGWNQGSGPKTWIKYRFFGDLVRDPSYGGRLLIEALLCLLFVIAIPFVARRFGVGYTAFVVVVIGVPLIGTSSMQGFGRYLITAFPVFALGGMILTERPRFRQATLVSSGLLLFVLASYFGRGFYLS